MKWVVSLNLVHTCVSIIDIQRDKLRDNVFHCDVGNVFTVVMAVMFLKRSFFG